MGKPIAGSLEKVLTNGGTPPNIESHNTSTVTVNNESGYIYIPSIGIYMAKEKTFHGKNWTQCHQALHEQNLRMPTIPQFIAFVNYLKSSPQGTNDASAQEIENILDDILTVCNPRRAECLDAKFTKQNNQLYVNYNHTIPKNGNIICEKQPLEICLMEDGYSDVFHPNRQGFPMAKLSQGQGGLCFWYPRKDRVAWFLVGSRVVLDCYRRPDYADASLGVRASFFGNEIKN